MSRPDESADGESPKIGAVPTELRLATLTVPSGSGVVGVSARPSNHHLGQKLEWQNIKFIMHVATPISGGDQ